MQDFDPKLKYLTVKHIKADSVEAYSYKLLGIELFSVAQDFMGIDICSKGKFYASGFRSCESGVTFLKGKEREIIWFGIKARFFGIPFWHRYFYEHMIKKVKRRFVYSAGDKDFPNYFINKRSSHTRDIMLYVYGFIKFRRKLNFWDVYKETGGKNFAN